MKKIVVLVAVVLFMGNIQLFSQENLEDKLKILLELMGSKEQFEMAIDQIIDIQKDSFNESLNRDFYEEFRNRLKKEGFEEISNKLLPIYLKYLTEEEIDGLIKFYNSEVGKSFITKQPLIMKESMQVGAEWGRQMALEIANQLFLLSEETTFRENFHKELKADCSAFKEGEFYYYLPDSTTVAFSRFKNKQIEKKSGEQFEYKIKWLSDCKYLMIGMKDNHIGFPSDTIIVNIAEIHENGYKYGAKANGEDFYIGGEIFKKE